MPIYCYSVLDKLVLAAGKEFIVFKIEWKYGTYFMPDSWYVDTVRIL